MFRTVEIGNRKISYTLERKEVKNLNLRIKANQSIFVSASKKISTKQVDAFVTEKSSYIFECVKRFADKAKYSSNEKAFVDGETVTLFGKNLRLKIKYASKNKVECDENYITLAVKNISDVELKKKTLDKWLRIQCETTIELICKNIFPKFKKYDIPFPEIQLREMISRWGSCMQKKGILTFNPALVAVPVSCIEYVVIHEFTHFMYPNHSPKFYQQLTIFMPDWRERKVRLDAIHV